MISVDKDEEYLQSFFLLVAIEPKSPSSETRIFPLTSTLKAKQVKYNDRKRVHIHAVLADFCDKICLLTK